IVADALIEESFRKFRNRGRIQAALDRENRKEQSWNQNDYGNRNAGERQGSRAFCHWPTFTYPAGTSSAAGGIASRLNSTSSVVLSGCPFLNVTRRTGKPT